MDVAHVHMLQVFQRHIASICSKIFHLFQMYVTNALSWMLHMFYTYVVIVCSKCFICFSLILLHVFSCCKLQVFYLDVAYILDVCCILFHVASEVSDVCCILFHVARVLCYSES
jgi:hypothetical protein